MGATLYTHILGMNISVSTLVEDRDPTEFAVQYYHANFEGATSSGFEACASQLNLLDRFQGRPPVTRGHLQGWLAAEAARAAQECLRRRSAA